MPAPLTPTPRYRPMLLAFEVVAPPARRAARPSSPRPAGPTCREGHPLNSAGQCPTCRRRTASR